MDGLGPERVGAPAPRRFPVVRVSTKPTPDASSSSTAPAASAAVSAPHVLGPCLFVQGVISPWCWAGVNRPIFTEVVRPQLRASILAYAVVLEGSSAALGAPLVGHLAEAFGYRTLAADAAVLYKPSQIHGLAALPEAERRSPVLL